MNLFELFVKIGVDDQASGKLGELSGKLGNGLKTAAKIGTAAVGAAAAGIGALTKVAVDNYAEYEQLVGGVETLFKENSGLIQELASNAYKTAGISANSYMEQATAFSASLIQALGGDTAAASAYANRAILDMSDNANKMGTDIETIQMTYQSLMRGNYAMLDNLKLGYGGTKAELERLVSDAEKLTGEALDPSKFSDVITAINAVQTELGITGTTVKEAGTTIEGSVNSMKAAWDNLITGIADDNADLEQLVDNFVTTIVGDGTENNLGVLGNVMPAVEMALKGAAKVVAQSAPIIAEELPKLMEEILPELASATANLIVALADQIPSMAQTLVDAAFQIVDEIGNAFEERIPSLSVIFENLETVVVSLTAAFAAYKAAMAISWIIDALRKATEGQTIAQTLLNAVMNANPFVLIATLIAGLVAAIITLWNTNDGFRESVTSAWESIKNVFSAVVDSIVGFFTESIPVAFNTVVEFFTVTVPEAISSFVDSVGTFFTETIPGFFENFVQWFTELPEKIAYWLGFAIGKLISWGAEAVEWVITEVPKIIDNIVNFFAELPGKIWEWLVNTVTKISEWVTNANAKVQEIREKVVETIVNFFKELPGKVWTWLEETASKIGSFISDIGVKIKTEVPEIITTFINFFKELPGKIFDIGKNIVDGLWNGIKNSWSSLTSNVSGLFGNLVSGIKKGLGIASPSKVFASIGGFMAEGLGEGWEDKYGSIKRGIQNDLQFKTATVDFANSGFGVSSAGIINSIGTQSDGDMANGLTVNLVLPDGSKFASWQLPYLIKAGSAAGTPIAEAQRA